VIAPHAKEPGFTQQGETVQHVWPTVDEIPHGDQPVDRPIESERLQASVKLPDLEVDVAHDEVAASVILGECEQKGHDDERSRHPRGRQRYFT